MSHQRNGTHLRLVKGEDEERWGRRERRTESSGLQRERTKKRRKSEGFYLKGAAWERESSRSLRNPNQNVVEKK